VSIAILVKVYSSIAILVKVYSDSFAIGHKI